MTHVVTAPTSPRSFSSRTNNTSGCHSTPPQPTKRPQTTPPIPCRTYSSLSARARRVATTRVTEQRGGSLSIPHSIERSKKARESSSSPPIIARTFSPRGPKSSRGVAVVQAARRGCSPSCQATRICAKRSRVNGPNVGATASTARSTLCPASKPCAMWLRIAFCECDISCECSGNTLSNADDLHGAI